MPRFLNDVHLTTAVKKNSLLNNYMRDLKMKYFEVTVYF